MQAKRANLLLILCLLAVLALGDGRPAPAQAGPPAAPAAPDVFPQERWRYGVTVESPLSYAALDGRLLAETAAFRSARSANIYFVFPAAATARTVKEIRYYILSRSGGYTTGDATLALKVYNFAGVYQRQVSSATINIEVATVNSWNSLTVAPSAAINPGEFLAFHFSLSAAAGGTLEVRPIFEVTVE